jgi:protein-S-isoprenylcysteine O-methyltransferase Ste14
VRFSGASLAATVVAIAAVALTEHAHWGVVEVHARWVRVVGLVVLAVASAFTIWARVVLGTMWSADAAVKQGHRLRTNGPYAVTRHPIYTGILGMLLGSTLLSGAGRWLLLVPVGLVVLAAKIRAEERLMAATFPEEYPAYRRRVPALVPRPRR